MKRCFWFSAVILTFGALSFPHPVAAQVSSAGAGCVFDFDSCGRSSSGGTPSHSSSSPGNAAINTFNAIQQNLQRNDQIIQNGEQQILNTIQQNQNSDTSTSTYNSNSGNSGYSGSDDSAATDASTGYSNTVPTGPDPAQLRNDAANQLLDDANSTLEFVNTPAAPAAADGAGVAAGVDSVLGGGDTNTNVASDVSNVLGGSNTNTNVAGDVTNVLGGSGSGESDLTPQPSTNAEAQAIAAAETEVPASPPGVTASPAQQIAEANTEVMEPNAVQVASNDEVTQQTEGALSADEQSPTLGGWAQGLMQSALSYAQQYTRDKVADSTSNDQTTQAYNELFYAAHPTTGMAPAMASNAGNPIKGVYDYLSGVVGKFGNFFNQAVNQTMNPNTDQQNSNQ